MEENELIVQLKDKKPEALEFCMDTYGSTVAYIVTKVLEGAGQKQDIEECVSDIFVDIWDKIETFHRNKGNLRTWIMMLARYKALDYRRKLLRKQSESLKDNQVIFLREQDNIEHKVLSKEKVQEMMQFLKTLNSPDRELFIQRYFYHYSIDTLAKEYDLSKQAVENRLYRGRKKLKDRLEEDVYLVRKE